MNKYFKEFLLRGLMFSGFGPIILAIIYAILEMRIAGFNLGGTEIFLGIISTYLLAFIHAGASVFNQIEEWPITKSLLCHFVLLYIAYVTCYILNSWIPFKVEVIAIFTLIFVILYFIIWLTVYAIIKAQSKKMNSKL